MSYSNPIRKIPAVLDGQAHLICLYHPHFYEVLARDGLYLVNASSKETAEQCIGGGQTVFAVTPLIVAASRESKKRLKQYEYTHCTMPDRQRPGYEDEYSGGMAYPGISKELESYLLKAGGDSLENFTVASAERRENAIGRAIQLAKKAAALKIG